MKDEALIVFVKNAEIGKVKTRLAKTIGDAGALAIYLKLLSSCFDLTQSIGQEVIIYYNNYIDSEDNWHSAKYKKYLQKGEDIGEKMYNAIAEQLSKGYKKVCLIGSDIYDLSELEITRAFDILRSKDVVVGPAADGGYYLIGMKEAKREIFSLSKWSTETVLKETLNQIENLGLSYEKTNELNDIDTIEDLRKTDLFKASSKH